MEYIQFFIELLTHTKDVLLHLFQEYGTWVYVILFLIIFVETGLVVFPLLPGDSLLFTAGLLCAQPNGLNVWLLIPILLVAAILGDNVNYFVGKFFNERVLSWKFKGKPLVKQQWLDQTHEFFEKNGSKAIILARFVPIVRTIAPFVAGVGKMNFKVFFSYNIVGGILWVGGVTLAGYLLGQVPVVGPFIEKHLEKFILGIVFVSVLPIIIEMFKQKTAKK